MPARGECFPAAPANLHYVHKAGRSIDEVLEAAQPFAAHAVAAEWQRLDGECVRSDSMNDSNRLLLRVGQLRRVLLWADDLPHSDAFGAADPAAQAARYGAGLPVIARRGRSQRR